MTLGTAVVKAHRWMGLIVASLWLLQALTGVFAVFHWEIDDALTPGAHRKTDLAAIERSVSGFAPHSIWATAGAPDRYDVNVAGHVIRVDGAGRILRVRRDDERLAHGGIVTTLVVLHQSLLAGDRGRSIIGASGVLLLSNMMLGLIAAWPRRGQWKRTLWPSHSGSELAALYWWHRASGLWIAAPAFLLIAAGVLLAFDNVTERLLQAAPEVPAARPSRRHPPVGMAEATQWALARYPGATVSGIGYPTLDNAVWTITLKQSEELQRAYGRTRVLISAVDGGVVSDFNALDAPPARRFLNLLFPFHTGEVGGLPGRVAVFGIGAWLIAVVLLGFALFFTRRHRRAKRSVAV